MHNLDLFVCLCLSVILHQFLFNMFIFRFAIQSFYVYCQLFAFFIHFVLCPYLFTHFLSPSLQSIHFVYIFCLLFSIKQISMPPFLISHRNLQSSSMIRSWFPFVFHFISFFFLCVFSTFHLFVVCILLFNDMRIQNVYNFNKLLTSFHISVSPNPFVILAPNLFFHFILANVQSNFDFSIEFIVHVILWLANHSIFFLLHFFSTSNLW